MHKHINDNGGFLSQKQQEKRARGTLHTSVMLRRVKYRHCRHGQYLKMPVDSVLAGSVHLEPHQGEHQAPSSLTSGASARVQQQKLQGFPLCD